MKVYEAIRQVTAAMSASGISKDGKNTQQGYAFRGIDAVLNALSGPLCDAGLTILPRVTERVVVERETKSGSALFNVTVKVEFDFVAAEDGSKHTVVTYGEAMDSADKATNKAMSAAYKYMALLAFCIPTEASPETDADFTTHEVIGKAKGARAETPAAVEKLTAHEYGVMLDAIKGAESMKFLRSHFAAAFNSATAANDTKAIADFTAAKDVRKVAIEAEAKALKVTPADAEVVA